MISSSLVLCGRGFSVRDDDQKNPIFYDWIGDGADIVGIEFHCSLDDPRLSSYKSLEAFDEIEISPFPKLWLSEKRSGYPLGCEAFGDLRFFGDAEDNLAIVVGLNDWLSVSQSDRLIAEVAGGNGGEKGD